MWGEILVRFLVGGAFVSLFALLGDLFKPKSFGGLFGAAPSVAIATLALTIRKHGAAYAAVEARSMVLGAIALLAYALAVSWSLHRTKGNVTWAVFAAFVPWLLVAAIGWRFVLGGPG
jgi:hypothetical protein